MELQRQQYLRAELTPLETFPSALPISSQFSSATSNFQYLPAGTPTPTQAENWALDQLLTASPLVHACAGEDQQGLSDYDQLLKSGPFRASLERSRSGSLDRVWLYFHCTARVFLQWCRQILIPSNVPTRQGSFTQSPEEESQCDGDQSWQYASPDTKIKPDTFQNDENVLSEIPRYVLDYAPLVHLFSGEKYWPCDIDEHLYHITPKLNFTPVQAGWQHPRLNNLSALNRWEYGRHVFLTSNDNVESDPEWLMGEKNIPVAPLPPSRPSAAHLPSEGSTEKVQGGRSEAPAVLIVVNKGHGIVDAFWFFFYSFNLGNVVILRFGNHVGDWEHSVVRFHNGEPKAIFVSEHFFGEAYSYQAVEKMGIRPVIYSATGTHAMYATAGTHAYILPWGLLHDRTDKGPLWDPVRNSHTYTYDLHNDTLRPSNFTPKAPTEWFHFAGHWGDKRYPLDDSRQYFFAGNYHYVSGPLGPKFKNLGRRKICQGRESERCVIRNWLGGSRLRRIRRPFEEDEMDETERVRLSTADSSY